MPDPQSHNLSRHQWKRKKKLNWRDSETVDQEGHEDEGRRRYTVVAGEPAVANGSYLRSPSKWLLRFSLFSWFAHANQRKDKTIKKPQPLDLYFQLKIIWDQMLRYFFLSFLSNLLRRWKKREKESDNRSGWDLWKGKISAAVNLSFSRGVDNPKKWDRKYKIIICFFSISGVIWHLFNLWKQHVIENKFSNPTCVHRLLLLVSLFLFSFISSRNRKKEQWVQEKVIGWRVVPSFPFLVLTTRPANNGPATQTAGPSNTVNSAHEGVTRLLLENLQ